MKTIHFLFMSVLFFTVFIFFTDRVSAQISETDNGTNPLFPFTVEERAVEVPLQSVLVLALKNNLDIAFQSMAPDIAMTDVEREKSAYDTYFSSQFSKYREKKQVGNVLGGASNAFTKQRSYDFDFGLQKKFIPGTLAELKLNFQDYATNLPFQGLNPQHYGELALSLTQPLLRDFGIETGRSLINIANLNFQMSEYDFQKTVMDVLYQVETYYWDLYFCIQDLKSKNRSLERAESLLEEFEIRIDAGTLAQIEIYQPKAEVALRQQEVIVAESKVRGAEDRLKSSLNLFDDEQYWDVMIIPKDSPSTRPVDPVLSESVLLALEKRPDFLQAQLGLKASDIRVRYTKNQTLPRIDLVGSIGTTGLSGTPRDTSGVFGPFYTAQPSPWAGSWDKVRNKMFDRNYYNYMIGVKIEIPLENRLAKSQHSKAKVQSMQAVTNLKNAENLIVSEVRDAVRFVETSKKVIESANASLELAKQKLIAEEKKFKVGMSTTHDVLEFQESLSQAESTLAYAKAEYNKALAKLQRVMGVLLEEKGFSIL